ncbi:MAG: hypothetical protein WCK35_11800 [Chloroflexota bacterium]
MLAPFIHFLPLTMIIRKRMLPCAGRVTVKVGQKVEPSDVVAETVLARQHIVLDIAQRFNVSTRRATALIKIKKGQRVNEGEILAESEGLFGREVKAPAEGKIVALGAGKLVLESGGSPFELLAGMQGTVTEVIANHGVVIRSTGCVIQGLWGNGHLDTGVMMSVMEGADEVFDPARLDVSVRSAIILGGHVDNPDVFKVAHDLPVRGLIVASMSAELLPLASMVSFPVMVIEGFGRRPINTSAYKLLSTNIRRVITLNAMVFDRLKGNRPELYISLPVSQDPPKPSELDTFTVGQIVRVISMTLPARIGTLYQINPFQTRLSNGLRAKTAEIELESGEKISAPFTNLEVLG